MEFGPMAVKVEILVTSEPTPSNLESLKVAAAALTDDRESIQVVVKEGDRVYRLITTFTMRRAAQGRVVGDIDREFKFRTWDLADYQDSIISFPKK